ncbi:MAG: hypothetical protein ACYTFT_07040, partial [Planctomycetota bacterium]
MGISASPSQRLSVAAIFLFALITTSPCLAQTHPVHEIGGQRHGWEFADNRAAGYVDVNENNQLLSDRSTLERELIEARVHLVRPAPENRRGAIRFATWQNEDKATIKNESVLDHVFNPGVAYRYRWYRKAGGPLAAPALKLFILSPGEERRTDAQAAARGYTHFNYELVYEPYHQGPVADFVWTEEQIDYDNGRFWLVVSMTPGGGLLNEVPRGQSTLLTLREWAEVFRTAGLDDPL